MAAVQSFSATRPGDPEPGDLIEIFRPAYQHWALYLGDGYIINVTPVGKAGAARRGAEGALGSPGSPVSLRGLVVDQEPTRNLSEILEGPDKGPPGSSRPYLPQMKGRQPHLPAPSQCSAERPG